MNGYKASVLIFLCVVFFIAFSTGCKKLTEKFSGQSSGKCSVISATETRDVLSPPSENLQVDIYLDATLSMKGFTETDSFSYYQQTIPLLESSVINTLKGEKVFYKFGNKSVVLKDRDYLQSQKPTFYADANFNTKTLIENVLENSNSQNLTIIVTDLFQNNADVNQLSEKIKSKFINANLAVGILGIKSQFIGTIYDVGSNNFSFSYNTLNDEAKYRPFYILAFGSHSNIARYFDALEQDGIKNFPVKQRVILSGNLSERPASFLGADITDKKNINELSGTIVKNEENLSDFGEFRVRDSGKPAVIEAQLPFQKLPGTVNVSEELELEVSSLICSGANAENTSSFAPQPAVMNAISTDAKVTKSEGINLKINVAPEKLERDEVSAFHLILRPKQLSLPDWINEWNMTDSEISIWSKNKNQFDGTKTYNLKHFLQTLWTTTQNVHKPKVADFYLYIKP